MPKASIQDLLDEGFTASQFGTPADWSTAATGYLARVLTSAGLWVAAKVGQVAYDALEAGSYALSCAQSAEVQYASAVLFRRRYAQVDGAAVQGMGKELAAVLAELRRKEDAALQNAVYWTGEAARAVGADDSSLYAGSGVASGTVETGRYPPVSGSAA